MKDLFNKLFSLSLFFLFGYPIFYFVYKFGDVRINGLDDYYSYYQLYKNFAVFEIDQAYLPRLISSFFVFAINKLGFFYDVPIAQQLEGYDQSVYFNAILVNFIGAIGTGLVLQKLTFEKTKNFLLSHFPGLMYFLSYGLITWGAYALVDGFAVFMFVLAFYFYQKKSPWVYLILVVSIFQRDLILVSMGALAFFDALYAYFTSNKISRHSLSIFSFSVLCFFTLFLLKATVFKTPSIYYNGTAGEYLNIFYQPRFSMGTFLRAFLFSQNILLIYFLLTFWVKINFKHQVKFFNLWRTIFVFSSIIGMCFIIKVPIEIGRYFLIFTGLIPYFIFSDLSQVFHLEWNKKIPTNP